MYKKGMILVVICCFVGAGIFPSISGNKQFTATTIYVDDDNINGPWDGTQAHPYQYIQDAVNNASNGDIIKVYSGNYFEKIFLDKTLSLIGVDEELYGNDSGKPVIEGTGNDYILKIDANGISISKFAIQNNSHNGIYIASGITNITIFENKVQNMDNIGILCFYTYNNYIHNNTILNCEYCGVHIRGLQCSNNILSNNKIYECGCGVYMVWGACHNIAKKNLINGCNTGVTCYGSSSYNVITENSIINCVYTGIELDSFNDAVPYCNMIIKNNISNNGWDGIWMRSSYNNIIQGNTINNNNYGIRIRNSSDNKLYHNTFTNNKKNASDDGSNIWYNGEKGNYWGDYDDRYPDAQKKWLKGIWDTPYEIPGGNNQDRHPLIKPYSKSKSIPCINSLFLQFLENHPHLFPLLRQLMRM